MDVTRGMYERLIAGATMAGTPLLMAHVMACILALAYAESAEEGGDAGELCGLAGHELDEVAHLVFGGTGLPDGAGRKGAPGAPEMDLRAILMMHAASACRSEMLLSAMIARRALRPNHLWQDLGLSHRGELSELMRRHFPGLARRNAQDMKWKKFFYRMMCSAEGFTLCAAPVCTECDDFEDCFGAEDGEALLARMANGKWLSSSQPLQGGMA
ncbi:nitrogen fixation protein NifQ [Novosphingobium sp. SG751A]|uniref:nitrogen fixation protein NifQ n=1 Tax=Novosphingobium sp. SG751A TaxID=2587000 RepID=UPI001C12C270|nr:nitrogen fixation protein NifQ [Novosphingobium sp. SG751A]NOW48485.1 nitrogen fixation protein NifQ [Novosphingobium sp. SG751A]